MTHAVTKVREEMGRLVPAVLFFFAAFNLIVLTENLTTEEYGVRMFRFAGAAVAALLIGKVVLLVDYLPFARAFGDRPLIYPTLWRTGIYVLAAVLFVYLEHVIPLLFRYASVAGAHRHLLEEIIWPRLAAILMWLTVLFFLFAATQQLSRAVGQHQLRRLFFGR
jgi:hypothetical protein